MALDITYRFGNDIDLDAFIQIYHDSTLGAVFGWLFVFSFLVYSECLACFVDGAPILSFEEILIHSEPLLYSLVRS